MDTVIKNKEEELTQLLEKIEDEGVLWCPNCKHFTPFCDFKFYGENSSKQEIQTLDLKEIKKFSGYKYRCKKCRTRIDSVKIGEIEV